MENFHGLHLSFAGLVQLKKRQKNKYRRRSKYLYQSIIVFCPRAGLSLQTKHSPLYPLLSLPFRPSPVSPSRTSEWGDNLRPESFTVERLIMPSLQLFQEFIAAVASHCFPHPTLSFASEQTLKDLKRSQGHPEEVKTVDLAN